MEKLSLGVEDRVVRVNGGILTVFCFDPCVAGVVLVIEKVSARAEVGFGVAICVLKEAVVMIVGVTALRSLGERKVLETGGWVVGETRWQLRGQLRR